MISRRLLYLNTHRLSAFVWQAGKLTQEGVFDNDDHGRSAFASYVASHRHSHFSLLANVAEEGHVIETIPFLQGKDRETLIRRKIGQHFLGTPLATSASLGFEKTKRKNERVLLCALTDPTHFEPWLSRLAQSGAPLKGIYSVAQLGGRLLKKLAVTHERCLLLTLQDHSIRESFVVNGKALFSRMAPLPDSSIAGIASSFSAESGKLHQYLIGQRHIGHDDRMPVVIVAPPSALPAIEKACLADGRLDFTLLDNTEAARQLKLQRTPEDCRCEALFLHLLATNPPSQQFASSTHRHDYDLSRLRFLLLAGGLVTLLGGSLFAAKQLYDARQLRDEAVQQQAIEADLAARYREITATFPQIGVDNDSLRTLTDRYRQLRSQQTLPADAYRHLGQALAATPAIELTGLDWKIGPNSASTAGRTSAGAVEITTVRGNIVPPPGSTTRQLLVDFDQFLALLRENTAVTINVIKAPIELESSQPLRGGDNEQESAVPRAFVLEILRNHAP
ncbi:hypothetical protein [Dechloromonas sp.]|uniref:hypothetical protein n=1 Tax=Dechloromonas sp. TaxID=1917218 RepID=UPI0011FF4EA1|nr:hypothetical protein [Dechloromonas sp.]MBU3696478.1 hypothetical protein [Dechloromonas sp.]TEX46929.1 MAG: hypothetical protein CFR70_09885 [Rhodocyclaceae bacterium]